jgi:hypothetical protein
MIMFFTPVRMETRDVSITNRNWKRLATHISSPIRESSGKRPIGFSSAAVKLWHGTKNFNENSARNAVESRFTKQDQKSPFAFVAAD